VSDEAWPTPTAGPSREPLPRVEDLPIAEQGYEPESVRAAFDSFYRHAAQLDAALRTLEAVDSFHRHAAALRADLRALRSAGWTQQSWSSGPQYGYGYSMRSPREGISPAVWRIAGEVAFLIAASVALGVSKVAWWVIVLVMAFAFLIVVAIEWLASRDRFAFARATAVPSHPVVEAEATPIAAEATDESSGWAAFEEAQEPSDAMTMIAPVTDDGAPTVEPVPEEAEEAVEEIADPEPEPVVEAAAADDAAPRRRWFRRSERPAEESAEPEIEVPHHVRVLSPDEQAVASDPWEQGLEEAAADEPEEETGEDFSAVAGEPEPSARRRFRRR
jgi:hypothetical protein